MDSTQHRLILLDAIRGGAVILMILYHLTWDAVIFGHLAPAVLESTPGVAARTGILGLFLVVSGVSFHVAAQRGLNIKKLSRRFAMLGAAASIVTFATILALPHAPVWFGVLHFLAIGTFILIPFAGRPISAAICGAAVAIAFLALRLMGSPADPVAAVFEHPALLWLGLGVRPIPSLDYVPLVPWLTPLLPGVAFAGPLIRLLQSTSEESSQSLKVLAWMGRHSLPIYLLHQPLALAGFALAGWISGVLGGGVATPLPWQ